MSGAEIFVQPSMDEEEYHGGDQVRENIRCFVVEVCPAVERAWPGVAEGAVAG